FSLTKSSVNFHNFFANSSSLARLLGEDSTPNGIKYFPRKFFSSISGLVAQYNEVNAPSSGVSITKLASLTNGIVHLPQLSMELLNNSVFTAPNEIVLKTYE